MNMFFSKAGSHAVHVPRVGRLTPAAALLHLALLGTATGALLGAMPGSALAQVTTGAISFSIPSGPLDVALVQFGQKAHVTVVADSALTTGVRSGGLQGAYGVADGLAQLLIGTGLQALPNADGNGYRLRALPRQAGEAAALAPVTVQGSLDAGTDGTASYASRAVTIGKGTQALRDIPQSVSVVTRQRMDDQNLNTLEDALRNVTGITVETLSSGPGLNSYLSRGYTLDALQVDGLTVPAGGGNVSSSLDLAMYDRIEVLRGPSGLYQGTGEPGGTVNLVRKRPLDGFAFEAQASVGSWDYYRGVADLSTPLDSEGRIRARLVAVYNDRGSFVDGVKMRQPAVYGIVEADLGPRTVLAAGVAHQRSRSRPAFGLPAYADGSLLDVDRSTSLSADWARIEEETTEFFVDVEHRLEGGGHIKASAFHRDLDTPTRVTTWSNSAVNPLTGQSSLIAWSYRNHWKSTGADVHVNQPFSLLGRAHTVLVGADFAHTQKDFSYGGGIVSPTNVYDPITDFPQPDMERVNFSEGRVSQFGLYGRLNMQLADPLKLIAGARLSWWKNDARSYNPYFGDINQNVTRVTARATPYAGLVWDLNASLSAYASYTSIFQPQTATDAQGNTLKPRVGRQVEIGLKGEFLEGRLNAHAALFQIIDRNRAMTDPDNPLFSVAAGKVRSQGFETEISGSPLPGWSLVAGYAYTTTKYLEASAAQKGLVFNTMTPRHAVNLWSRYEFQHEALRGFSLGLGLRYNSGFYAQSGATRWEQGSYTVATAQLGYRYNRHLEGSLTVDNLFDRKYYEKLGGASRQNYYGQPRSVMLNLRYRY